MSGDYRYHREELNRERMESGQQRAGMFFKNIIFEQRAESSEGVPTWPFRGRACRYKEQQVRGPRQEHACTGRIAWRPEWLEHHKQGAQRLVFGEEFEFYCKCWALSQKKHELTGSFKG